MSIQHELIGSYAKVTLKYSGQKEEEVSVNKGDTVQIVEIGHHNNYKVRLETAIEGWLPAFVIGQRDHEESTSR